MLCKIIYLLFIYWTTTTGQISALGFCTGRVWRAAVLKQVAMPVDTSHVNDVLAAELCFVSRACLVSGTSPAALWPGHGLVISSVWRNCCLEMRLKEGTEETDGNGVEEATGTSVPLQPSQHPWNKMSSLHGQGVKPLNAKGNTVFLHVWVLTGIACTSDIEAFTDGVYQSHTHALVWLNGFVCWAPA